MRGRPTTSGVPLGTTAVHPAAKGLCSGPRQAPWRCPGPWWRSEMALYNGVRNVPLAGSGSRNRPGRRRGPLVVAAPAPGGRRAVPVGPGAADQDGPVSSASWRCSTAISPSDLPRGHPLVALLFIATVDLTVAPSVKQEGKRGVSLGVRCSDYRSRRATTTCPALTSTDPTTDSTTAPPRRRRRCPAGTPLIHGRVVPMGSPPGPNQPLAIEITHTPKRRRSASRSR